MTVIVQVILGLLLLIIIYFVVRKVVDMPQIHRYAKQQYERFIQNLYQDEREENKK
nr:hypothetical protein [uncultured Clostridium sp.]